MSAQNIRYHRNVLLFLTNCNLNRVGYWLIPWCIKPPLPAHLLFAAMPCCLIFSKSNLCSLSSKFFKRQMKSHFSLAQWCSSDTLEVLSVLDKCQDEQSSSTTSSLWYIKKAFLLWNLTNLANLCWFCHHVILITTNLLFRFGCPWTPFVDQMHKHLPYFYTWHFCHPNFIFLKFAQILMAGVHYTCSLSLHRSQGGQSV